MSLQALATTLCQTLFDRGYVAYFAGGWVRDLLLNKPTDEIDIATSAPPEVVQELFDRTIPVGIAFGVVVVVLEGINFEVATFRKDHPYLDGRHPDGVDFSTPEKDAQRRDFTINGMFYDPLTTTILDYVGGKEDLQKHVIRAIGNPESRFAEDRLRMIRAIRFAARLGFRIEEQTAHAITTYASTLFPSVSMERVWQEFCKMAAYPYFDQAIMMLHRFGLLPVIFPQLHKIPLETIEQEVAPYTYFPLDCPPIAYLLELFPNLSLDEKLGLCDYLKMTGKDRKLVDFFHFAAQLFKQSSIEPYEWVHFYAHSLSELFLQVQAAKILPPDRTVFHNEHQMRQKELKTHIERIEKRKPLVTAAHLKEMGVEPGKKMGLLLKEAERTAINKNLSDPLAVISAILPIK